MQPNNNQDGVDLTSQLFPKRTNQVTKPVFGQPGSAPEVKEVVVNEPTIVPSSSMSNMTPPTTFSRPTKSNKSLLIVLIVLIVVLLGAGVVWGVMKGVGPFGNPPYDEDSLAKSIVAGIGKLKNASYSLNIKVYSEAKESDVEALNVVAPTVKQARLLNVVNMQNYLSYIPADFKFDGTVSGSSERVGEKSLNNHLVIDGTANANGISMSGNLEFKSIDGTYYLMVKELPSLFFDISKLKDKWIKITEKDATSYGGSYFGLDSEESEKSIEETKKRGAEQAKTFLEIADRNKALLRNGNPVKDSVSGKTAYRYNLEFNKDTMVKFYTELTESFGATYGDKNPIKFDESTLAYLKSSEFDRVFEYMRKNTTLILWADADGIPVQLQYSLRMVPNDMNSDKQVKLIVTLTLNDINKSVKIEAPAESLSVEEVTLLMTGQSKEQYRLEKQVGSISSIQYALSSYFTQKKTYPASLEELLTTKSSYGDSNLLRSIPKDVYSDKAFVYAKGASDYTISYDIVLPDYVAGDSVSSLYTRDYSSGASKMIMKVVNGKNTTTSKHVSVEAYNQSQKDTDLDKVPDLLEKYIGSSISKKDTDGDGQTDYDEIVGGNDPLGPGKLKGSTGMFF
jgi:flagellar basal body-associated protein FliL